MQLNLENLHRYLKELHHIYHIERPKKDDLCNIYNRRVRPLTEDDPEYFAETYLTFLIETKSKVGQLEQGRSITQIVNKYQTYDKSRIGEGLQQILCAAETQDWIPAIDRFDEIVASKQVNMNSNQPHWGIRRLVTTLLMLHYPDQYVGLGIGEWRRSTCRLVGRRIPPSSLTRLTGNDLEQCQHFASVTRSELSNVGWKPRDMVDVHCFLQVAGKRYSK